MSSISGLDTGLYWPSEDAVPVADNSNSQLSQEDFFAMLTEQLSNQDPTKPVDNDQMVAQMTSFTMADSLSRLNDKFDAFAQSMNSNQALQASSLIGQEVLVNADSGTTWKEGNVYGAIVAETDVENLQIQITDEYGQVVRTIEGGSQSAGNISFGWDGTDDYGNFLPRGKYIIEANGTVGGQNQSLDVVMEAQVTGSAVAADDMKDVQIIIEDQAGQVIRNIDVGNQYAGSIDFGWDGTDNNGYLVPPGDYKIKIQGTVNGQDEALQFGINRRVTSVSLTGSGTDGVILNLAGDQNIKLADVIRVGG
ncbi:flagellar biosynthesis protein FlgD [Paraneptunicella aestuarii]|uniref:FlgD immunoglobulin-like domain containing protein n=1 Tax=Paraneptunicella aestuarii TaxID=2831148 RepID=UPI001E4417A5|nr:FlgD immunoglobulin-like domain containing protein [Paraneptunicella aestuarii]UAA39475.1 flagellar biosynthesis protein FlgD [Paraneptunicella aestuarii]